MTEPYDATRFMTDMFSGKFAGAADPSEAMRNAARFTAQMNRIALDAATKSAELSHAWTRETLSRMETFAQPHADTNEAVKVIGNVATEQMQGAPEHVAKFAEVAKEAQMATVELMMSAGKDARDEFVSTAREVANDAADQMDAAAKTARTANRKAA